MTARSPYASVPTNRWPRLYALCARIDAARAARDARRAARRAALQAWLDNAELGILPEDGDE